jgi:prolyl-tRNA synthetase
MLENITERARAFLVSFMIDIEMPEQAKGKKGIFKISWCGSESCGRKMQELSDADILGETEPMEGHCPVCNAPTTVRALLAKPY